MQITPSDTLCSDFADDLNTRLNAGGAATVEIYTGTKPAKPDTAITTQTLLGTCTCSATAGTYANRRFTFNAITQDSAADDSGTATWARFKSGAGTAVLDVDITTTGGGGFMQMNNTAITAGGPISITSCYVDF